MESVTISRSQVDQMITRLLRIIKSDPEVAKAYAEPRANLVANAASPSVQLVLGQRGSGKSALLFKAIEHIAARARPFAYVSAQDFQNMRSLENVKIHIYMRILKELDVWLAAREAGEAAAKWWFGAKSQALIDVEQTRTMLVEALSVLKSLLLMNNEALVKSEQRVADGVNAGLSAGLKAGEKKTDGEVSLGASLKYNHETASFDAVHQRLDKPEALESIAVPQAAEVVNRIADLAQEVYVIIDDLHFLDKTFRRPLMLSLLSVCNTIHPRRTGRVWLKVATDRSRVDPLKGSADGLKEMHDWHVLDLDETLRLAGDDFFRQMLIGQLYNVPEVGKALAASDPNPVLSALLRASNRTPRVFFYLLYSSLHRWLAGSGGAKEFQLRDEHVLVDASTAEQQLEAEFPETPRLLA